MEALRLIKIEAQTEQLQETGRNWFQASSRRQQLLWGLIPMKQETHLCPHESPRVDLALIFRPCLCVMAKCLRDVCALPESECSGAPDAASSSATCRGRWRSCASSRRLNLRTGPSSPSAASRTRCRSATWAWMASFLTTKAPRHKAELKIN